MQNNTYINDKLLQLQLLLDFLPFCTTKAQKEKIEIELQRIQYLINNAQNVTLVNAAIEGRLNYETPKPAQTYKFETGTGYTSITASSRILGKTRMDIKQSI